MANEPISISLKMRFVSVALVTTFIVGTIAGPWQPRSDTQCATVCTDNTKFNYDIGKTYVYDYDADTANSLQDGKEASRLRIQAKVEIQPVSKCDFAMRLLDVSLRNSESSRIIGSDEFTVALERYPLRFGYQDGRIEDLCPDLNEPTWVLNIKRGILSTFQNTMENLEKDHSHEETDITGKCKTNYKVLEGGLFSQATIQKTKDLTDCSDRSDVYTAIQSSPLQEQSAFGPSTPVIKSSHECQHQVQNGKLHKSQCTEEHAFQPFSRQSSGAITKNTQTLTYVLEKPTTFANNDYIPTHKSLLYDHTDRRQKIDQSEVEESLKELCTVAENDIRPQVPRLFSKFVQKLQQLDYNQLYNIYKNIDPICGSSSKARKFLLDAIPLTGSEAGITLMKDMILQRNVLDTEADAWFLMLGFTPKPTKTMIENLMPLLEVSSKHPKALLGISALIHTYCKDNSECGQEQEVKNFLKVLGSKLGTSCYTNNNEEKEVVILSLKALGNVGSIGDIVSVVKQCYSSVDNSMDVRLAAIDAFRRLPCSYNRDELLQKFFDVEEDSEIRIGSYLAAMKCPTTDMLDKVRESLDQEQINQVGSFVWTHLTNHQESSHPYKHNILKILSSKKLQKKFSTDVRKFSRYYEGSLYVDALRTGMHLDGSVVFSSKSYLPRSSSLGLTLELFGETVDLFEVGGRVEGFEFLVESFFGPRGYFPDDTIQKILESSREQESYSQSKLNEIAKIFNLKNTYGEDPRGSFYMRVFGNDLHYTQFQGIEQLIESSQRFSLVDALLKLTRSEESEYTKSFMFMDSSIIIPTSVGLPLNLTVNGTVVANLRIGGKVDLSRLASKSLDVKTHIEPSAAVEISGSMITDAFVTRSGLKISATLHTSTYSDVAISVENGQVVKAQINMPKEQMEIFDIQSKVISINGCEETDHKPLTDNQVQMETCTGNGISKYLGLQLCSHLQYPVMSETSEENPSWLLAGPFSANIYLHKTDKGLQSYNFEYRWDKQTVTAESGKTLATRTGRLSLDTPGSTVDRELTAEIVYDESQKSLAIRLASPIKKMTMNGKIVNENGLKQLDVKWIVDEMERFALETELAVDTTKENYRLSPSLNVRYYGKPIMTLKGYLSKIAGKQYGTEITLEHLTPQPITISGVLSSNLGNDGSIRYDTDFTVDAGVLKTYAKGYIQAGNSNIAIKGTADYRLNSGPKHSMAFAAKLRQGIVGNNKILSGNVDFQCLLHPEYNFAVNVDSQRSSGHLETTLAVVYGDNRNTDFNKLSFQHKYNKQGSFPEHRIVSITKVSFPPADIDASAELRSELNEKHLETVLALHYDKNKQMTLTVVGNKGEEGQQELVQGFVKISLPERNMKLSGDVRRNEENEYSATVAGNWMDGEDAKIVFSLKNKTPGQFNQEVSTTISLPGQEPLTLTADVLLNDVHNRIRGEATMNGQNYKTYVECLKPTLENFRISAGAVLPTETYSAAAELSTIENEKSLKTDLLLGDLQHLTSEFRVKRDGDHLQASAELNTEVDSSKKKQYRLHFAHRQPMLGSEGQIQLECPDQKMGVSWKVNRDAPRRNKPIAFKGTYELWWNDSEKLTLDVDTSVIISGTSRDISAKFLLHTPFYGLEQIGFQCNHNDDRHIWKNSAIVSLYGESLSAIYTEGKVAISDESKRLRATVKVETPLPLLPTLNFNVDLKQTGEQFDSDVQFKWSQNEQMEFSVHGNFDGTNLNGGVNISTPFPYMKDLSLSGDILRQDKTTGQMRFSWNDQVITIDVEGNGHVTDQKIDAYTKIHLTTPIHQWNDVLSSLRFSYDQSSLLASVELSFNKAERIAVEINVAHQRPTSTVRSDVLSLHFVSPFKSFEDMLLTLSRETGLNRVRNHVELKYDPQNEYSAGFELNIPSSNNVHVKVEAKESYGVFDNLLVEGHYLLDRDELKYKANALLKDKSFDLEANMKKIGSDKYETYTGLLRIDIPVLSVHNAEVKFEHKIEDAVRNTQVQATLDRKPLTLEHNINYKDALNFENSLQLRTPYLDITVTNKQQSTRGNFNHNSELNINKGDIYSVLAKYQVGHGNENQAVFNYASPRWQLNIAAIHDFSSETSKLTLEYSPNNKYELTSRFAHNSNNGDMQLTLTTPIDGLQEITVVGNYEQSAQEKSAKFAMKLTESIYAKVQFTQKLNGRNSNTELIVNTPIARYETSSANVEFNLNDEPKSAAVNVNFGEKAYKAAGQYNIEKPGKGQYELTLYIPIENIETVKLVAKHELVSPDKSISLVGETNSGRYEFTAFHNRRPNSIDSGLSFTSPIDGYERVTLASHHDSVGNENKALLSFEKPNYKVELSSVYDIGPNDAHVNVVFSSPISGMESLTLDGRYAKSQNAESFILTTALNGQSIKFGINDSGDITKRRMTISLQTPFEGVTNNKLIAEYNLEKMPMTGSLVVMENDQRADLECSIDIQSNNVDFIVAFTSPIEQMKSLKVKGNYKTENEMVNSLLVFEKDTQNVEARMTTALNNKLRGFTNFVLKTPFEGYEHSEVYVEFDGTTASKEVTVHIRKEQQQFDFNGQLNLSGHITEVAVSANTTVQGYETMSASLSIDASNNKKIHTLTLNKGDETYQAKWELVYSAGQLESNLKLKTPHEDALLYGQYNLNGANAITFDVKAIKHRTMMELGGRLWRDPQLLKAEGSLVFNTNLMQMIAFTLSGRYNVVGAEKEFVLQSECNGERNAIQGKMSKSNEILKVSIDGSSTILPNLKNFALDGTVDLSDSQKKTKVTLTRNNDNVEIIGSFANHQNSKEGSFKATTSFAGYESLEAQIRLTTTSPEKKLTVSFKSNNEHLEFSFAHLVSGRKHDLNASLRSSIKGYKTAQALLTVDGSGNELKISSVGNIEDKTFKADLVGSANQRSGDIRLSWSSNLQSIDGDNSIVATYDTVRKIAMGKMKSNGENLYLFEVTAEEAGKIGLMINTPFTKTLKFLCDHKVYGNNVVLNCRLTQEKLNLFSMSLDVRPMTSSLNVNGNIFNDNINLSFDYDLQSQQKTVSANYNKGNAHFEFDGTMILSATKHESTFSMKTSVPGFESLKYEAHYESKNSELEALLQLRDNEQFKFTFSLPENSMKITLSSPFKDYENMQFVATKYEKDSTRHHSMEFEWQNKKMSLTSSSKKGALSIIFSSPFEGFDSVAIHFTHTDKPIRAMLLVHIAPDQKYQAVVVADLNPRKSRWNLSLTTPIVSHESYTFNGYTDFETDAKAGLLLEGRGQQIDAKFEAKHEHGGRSLEVSLATPFENMEKLSLGGSYGKNNNERTAQLQGNINGKKLLISTNFIREKDGFNAGLQIDSIVSGVININVLGKATKENLEFNINVKDDSSENLVSFAVHAVHILRKSVTASVQLSSVIELIPTCTIKTTYVRNEADQVATFTARLNDLNLIQAKAESKPGDAKFNFNSQIYPFGHTVAKMHLYHKAENSGFTSSLEMEKTGKMSFDIEMKNPQPRNLELSAKLKTPFEVIPEMTSTLTIQSVSNNVNVEATLKTPFAILPRATLTIQANRSVNRKDNLLRLQLEESTYAIRRTLIQESNGDVDSTIVIETPFSNYETVTISAKGQNNYKTGRQMQLQLSTPNTKTTLDVMAVIQSGNHELHVDLDSTFIGFGPLNFKGKYINVLQENGLVLSFKTSQSEHGLTWNQAEKDQVTNGKLSAHCTNSDSKTITWSVDYSVAIPTATQPKYVLSVNTVYDGHHKCSSSLKVTMDRSLKSFAGELHLASENSEHSVAADYMIGSPIFKSQLAIKSRLLPFKFLGGEVTVNNDETKVLFTIGNVKNIFTAKYRAMSSKSYDVQMQVDMPSLSITEATLNGKLLVDDEVANGEITFEHPDFTAAGMFRRSPQDLDAVIKIKHPDQNIGTVTATAHLIGKNYRKVDGQISLTTDASKMAITAKWDVDNLNGNFMYSVDDVEKLGIQATFQRNGENAVEGHLTIKCGNKTHHAQLQWKRGQPESNFDFQVQTPLMGIDSLSIQSRLLQDQNRNVDGSFSMTSPTSNHLFAAKLQNDENAKQMEVMANTPYFGSSAYTLTGKVLRENSKVAAVVVLSSPTDKHTVQVEFYRDENMNPVFEAKLETPVLNIKKITFKAQILKLNTEEINAICTLATSQATHNLEFNLRGNPSSVEGSFKLNTPSFGLGTITGNLQLSFVSQSNLDVNVSVERGTQRYTVKASIHRINDGLQYHAGVTTPTTEDFEISGKFYRNQTDGLNIEASLKTPNNEHHIEAQTTRTNEGFNGHVKIDSPLISCKTFTISGNLNANAPTAFNGDIAIETPGKNFKLQTNYRNTEERHTEGGFSLTTPFETLPVLKFNGRLNRNANLNGGLSGAAELHTSNDRQPEIAINVNYQKTRTHSESMSLTVQTATPGYEHIEASYSCGFENGGIRTKLAFATDEYTYGWNSLTVRTEYLHHTYLELVLANQKYVFEAKTERSSNGSEINFQLELPKWQKIAYKLQSESDERKQKFLSVLSGNDFEYSVSGELRFLEALNFDGSFDVKTTTKGFEKLSSTFQQTYKQGYLHFTFEQLSADKPIFNVLVENNHYNGKGNGKFVLTTPFSAMKDTNAFYSYDKMQNDATGNVGLNYNGQKLLQINAASKDGTKVVEINNPIRPISLEYTYINNDDTIKISGKYCWDNEHKEDSSVGFNAQVSRTNSGRKMIIRTVHPTKPMTVTFLLERFNENFVHSGEVSWGSDSSSSASYLISTTRHISGSASEQTTYETKYVLVLPIRTFEIQTEDTEKPSFNSRSVIFKWDAGRNDNKHVGLKYEHHDLSSYSQLNHRVKLSLQHYKLEKDLTMSGELVTFLNKEVVFFNRFEVDYSRNEDQKFSIETKILDNSESNDESRFSLRVNVQHLVSNTDISFISDMVNNSQEMLGGIQLSYLDSYGHRKNLELQSKILKLRNQIQMLMESQANKLEMSGQLKNLQHGYLLHLESKLNGMAPYTADLQLDREEGHKADLKVVYNPDKKSTMMMRTAMPDKKTISINVYRQENENKINDIEFLVNLNNSQELVTKFHWRPNALQNIETSIPSMMRSFCSVIRNTLQELSESLSKDANKKYHSLRASFGNSISPAVEDANQEMSYLNRDAQEMIKVLQQAYQENKFYIRTIYDAVAPLDICKHACKFVMNLASATLDAGISVIEAFSNAISGMKNMCEYVCQNYLPNIKGRITDIPHAIVHHANKLHAVSRRILSHVVLQTLRTFKEMTVYIVNVAGGLNGVTPEWVHRVSNDATAKLQGYLDQFFASTYYQHLKQSIEQLISALQDVYNHAFWERLWISYSDKLQRTADYMSNNPHMQKIYKLTEGIYEMGVWAYDFLNVENLARDMLHVVMSRAEHIALHVLQEMILPELHLPSMEQSIMFNPEDGKLEIRQQLPVPWNSFHEYPQIQGTPMHEEFVRFKNNVNRLPKLTLHNFKNAWNSEFKWDSVVPSLRGRALLVGNQHYVTFDNRAYEFAGECSYLLARDFLDNNFTAIVNYEREGENVVRRSLVFILDGHHIEISSDMKVAIDGARTELPTSIGLTRLSHLGKVLSLDNDVRQVWMKCDTTYNACLLEIGAFYHGKTGGLFGTFDHEPSNDFMTPEQKKMNNLEAFTKSWEVGNEKCQSHKNNAYKVAYNSYKVQKQCDDLFGGYNSLRSCLKKVNPSSYMDMCMNDATEGKGPCSAAAAYAMMCRANGVSVSLPDSCLECDVMGKTVQQGDEVVVEGSDIRQSVDVVFVVDNSWQCSTTFPNLRSTVSTIARNFEGAFDSASINNNRYAVVGFGVGAPNHPQVITADGQTFGPLRSLDLALNNTHFAAGHHHHISDLIRYGVDLPFRVGVSKVFVVVPCAEADETIETSTFNNLITEFSNMDATLHLISIREPVLNSENKIKASDILGYDSKTAYTLKSVQRGVLVGDKDARQQIVPPKTMMTALVFHTNGSIFLANRLGSVQPKISKVANEVFARRVALRATPPSCQNCMCTVSTDGSPKVICSKCSTGDVIEVKNEELECVLETRKTVFPKDDFKKMNSSKSKNNHLTKEHGRRSGLKRVLEEKSRYHKV